ncbi:MAG: YtxH domain-containing protein [Bacteroidetes bacterium]|nr:YtxH domain-containing protein [Bacteroidota bacterium]
MSKKSNSLFAFLLGTATGAILGILYAPDKGSNTRDRLSYKLDKYRSILEDLIEDLINGDDLPNNAAKSQGQKVIDNAKERAEKLLVDVDNLIEHIKSEDSPKAK